MNLGLAELTDDQLLNLLKEVLEECIVRDPVVVSLTQEATVSAKEKKSLFKQWLKAEMENAKAGYIREAENEVRQQIRAEIGDAVGPLLSSAEEADVLAEADLKERIRMCEEAAPVVAGRPGYLMIEINGFDILMKGPHGERLLHRTQLPPPDLVEAVHVLQRILSVGRL